MSAALRGSRWFRSLERDGKKRSGLQSGRQPHGGDLV